MESNIASVSWPDHLSFGEGEGRLATPDDVLRRMHRWRHELDAGALHWRLLKTRLEGRFTAAPGWRHPTEKAAENVGWDDLEIVPELARQAGLRSYLYVSLFDDGRELPPEDVREVSYHNEMHGQHVAWQTEFSRRHPEFTVVDRSGERRQEGVLSLAYEEVRRHFRERFVGVLRRTGFEGLFVCLRSQSRPADLADQFGFNERARQEFRERTGKDPAEAVDDDDFPIGEWRDLLGAYLTRFLVELRGDLDELSGSRKESGVAPESERGRRQPGRLRLGVGCARGDVLGPPLGNATLDWRGWAERGLVDDLVIDQNSCRCPSMWHRLWPMHRGVGYVQDYLTGEGMPPLREHLESVYRPALSDTPTDLYVARQWDERSDEVERALLAEPVVSGLVFSTFRNDNPVPVARGDWRA